MDGDKQTLQTIPAKTFNLSPIISTGSNYIDNGSGQCDENGDCIIYLEDNFIDTSDTSCIYQVFLTQIGDKKVEGVTEKTSLYFKVKGEPYSNFDWLILSNTNNSSTERFSQDKPTENSVLEVLSRSTEQSRVVKEI